MVDKGLKQTLKILTKENHPKLIEIDLKIGDALFFKGQELPHYRRQSIFHF